MLVLTRQKNESAFIFCPDGSRIRVMNLKAKGSAVKLGIEAPEGYKILRDEHLTPEELVAASKENHHCR